MKYEVTKMPVIKELPFSLTADEQDVYFGLLTDNQTIDRFRFLPNRRDRKERFFGHTIGLCGNEQSKTAKGDDRSRSICIDEKDFRVNDMQGPSRNIGFHDLEKCPRGKDLLAAVETWLRDVTREKSDGYLQCNANLYDKKSSLDWHRDDVIDYEAFVPPTFWEAAVTVVLCTKAAATTNSSSFALASLENHADRPYGEAAEYQILYHDKSFYLNQPGRPVKRKFLVNFAPEPNDKTGVPLGVHGYSYRNGLHSAVMPWTREIDEAWSRLSLNFRLVKSSAWREIDRSAKINESCTLGASCWHKL